MLCGGVKDGEEDEGVRGKTEANKTKECRHEHESQNSAFITYVDV